LLNYHPTAFDRHEEFPKVIVQTLWENKISPSLLNDVCGQTVIIGLGRLGSLPVEASILKDTLLVAGHDPPIDITMYLDISINPGPQLSNTIETIITNRTKTMPRNRFRHYSNLVQVPLAAPAIVYNNTVRLIKCCVLNTRSLRNKGPEFVDYICDSEINIAIITELNLAEIC
jgi:hypothetical protein